MVDLLRRRSTLFLTSVALLMMLLAMACSGSDSDSEVTYQPDTAPVPQVQKAGAKEYASPPSMMIDASKRYRAVIRTNMGDITVELFPKVAPLTVNNFVFLAREGFYNGVPFHRVIKGFMIQSGDPTGTGTGGPGYTFKDEPVNDDYTEGTLAMANRGENTNGSQFFITDADRTGKLPKNYTIFGRVIEGMDVVHQIAAAPVTTQFQELSKPTVDLHISSIDILRSP